MAYFKTVVYRAFNITNAKKVFAILLTILGISSLLYGINLFNTLNSIQAGNISEGGLGEFAYWAGGWFSISLSIFFFVDVLLLYIFKKPKRLYNKRFKSIPVDNARDC